MREPTHLSTSSAMRPIVCPNEKSTARVSNRQTQAQSQEGVPSGKRALAPTALATVEAIVLSGGRDGFCVQAAQPCIRRGRPRGREWKCYGRHEFRPPWAEMPSGRAPRATPDDVVPVAAAQLLLSRVEEEEEEEKVEEDDGKSSLRSRLSIFSSTGSISVSFADPEERLVPADSPTQTQARLEINFSRVPRVK